MIVVRLVEPAVAVAVVVAAELDLRLEILGLGKLMGSLGMHDRLARICRFRSSSEGGCSLGYHWDYYYRHYCCWDPS